VKIQSPSPHEERERYRRKERFSRGKIELFSQRGEETLLGVEKKKENSPFRARKHILTNLKGEIPSCAKERNEDHYWIEEKKKTSPHVPKKIFPVPKVSRREGGKA